MVAGVEPSSGERVLVPLCPRCCEEAFSLDSLEKLFDAPPKIPGGGEYPEISDGCFDGESQYEMIYFHTKNLPPDRGPILRLHVPVKDLMRSSRICGFCRIVVDLGTNFTMAKGRYEEAQVDMQLFFPAKHSGTWLPHVMQVSLTLESDKWGTWQNSRLLAFIGEAEPWAEVANEGQETSNEEAALADPVNGLLEEAKRWMQECEDCHTDCALADASLLPTRILDVQALESVGSVKLAESTDGQRRRYIALSYVWGQERFLRLLGENYQTLMDAVPLKDLPKTIEDAVQVT